MLAIAAAVVFFIAFILNATKTSTEVIFGTTSLTLVGLTLAALHLAGVGAAVQARRGRRR
ncbi:MULTISPECIES: hypothetical protein [Streptomyces]|uniref:DUF3188 domain-containing protein n=1 Tax=Streptomyces niveus TaxID=193462 RepID=A0ABZ2A3T3_STRNV|nr:MULTISPECIES: hypothetical protein [Streptomyces]TFI27684.1 hypothetical protein E4P36_13035 [Streptomyces sp. 4R-3d]